MLSNRELSYHDTLSNIKKNQITVRRCGYATEQREFTNVKSNAQNKEERSYRMGTLLFPFFLSLLFRLVRASHAMWRDTSV